MEIIFNNQVQYIEEQSSIRNILDILVGDKQKGIAVAVNQAVVSREQWESYILHQNDNVLVIKATQGG